MTGQQLFNAYVNNGLCTDSVYEWAKLTVSMQHRWNSLARDAALLMFSLK